MEKLHTPEPWEEDGMGDYIGAPLCEGNIVAQIRGWGWLSKKGEEVALEIQKANARRIVACVNACRSASDEDLADDCVEKMKEDRDALLIQRDSLLSALRALYGWQRAEVEHFGATTPDDFIIEMVEKSLKSVEGNDEP